ncbi:hypothetical protein POM88_052058 [Heracleum sosnowskyi]|uniref:Uncharacterized protein n=1 Tax=Heracleum sosnowskyi TaxID=360622 RepID=A0AAD8GSE5_9APIA|nr:hypothetical protein POM88_052058 [Heracleum sosnowskyi]
MDKSLLKPYHKENWVAKEALVNSSNAHQSSNNSPPSRSSTIRRQGLRVWNRQRSETSGRFSRQRGGTSTEHTYRVEEFTFADLVAATNSFSQENKIGSGSFDIVCKELLTGKRAIFKSEESGGTPISVVDFTVPLIMTGELMKILDPRVRQPELNEAETVEFVAYTIMCCVNLEGL